MLRKPIGGLSLSLKKGNERVTLADTPQHVENTSIMRLRTPVGGLPPETLQVISMLPRPLQRRLSSSRGQTRQTRSLDAWRLTPREEEIPHWLAKGYRT